MVQSNKVVEWLLDSDPAIRWQVMRDILDVPESKWAAERAKIEVSGWGERLLSLQDADGQWAGGAFVPRNYSIEDWKRYGQSWKATCFSLQMLREMGFDPKSDRAKETVGLIGLNCRWDHDGQPYWDGEVEECINGRTVADGAYFGVDVSHIVQRLITEQQADGGWNCERANGSVRSSYHTTINVLEGLLEFEKATGGTAEGKAARKAGELYLLERGLFRRLSTGLPADEKFLHIHHPNRWEYDILRALDYFRSAGIFDGTAPDERLDEAVAHVRSKRLQEGAWPLERTSGGPVWFAIDSNPGEPSKWLTLRAMRVLKWWDSHLVK